MMVKLATAAGLLGIVLTMQGCVLAPGQHLNHFFFRHSNSELSKHVELVEITPKLIAMDQASRAEEVIPRALFTYVPEEYRIGPGDILYITVWEHPELTSPAGSQQQNSANGRLVRPDGTLYYPYVGTIHVSGMTIEQLRSHIAKKISAYVMQPQVDVNIIQYDSQHVWLNGAFQKPGMKAITVTPLTLGQAVAEAMPDTKEADLSGLMLRRDGTDYQLDLNALQHGIDGADSIYLKDGDKLFLSYNDRHQVYLMGEVARAQAVPFKTATISLAEALGKTGGLSQVSSKGKAIYVIRGVEDLETSSATIYQLKGKNPAAFILADNFELEPSDIVFVGAAGITRWNRFLSQLLPSANLISASARAHKDANDD